MNVGPYEFLIILGAFYIFLGLFLEGVTIFVTTLPLAFPVMVQLGFDPVWFGIFLVIAVELGCMHPPVGVNIYVLQGLTGQSVSSTSCGQYTFLSIAVRKLRADYRLATDRALAAPYSLRRLMRAGAVQRNERASAKRAPQPGSRHRLPSHRADRAPLLPECARR